MHLILPVEFISTRLVLAALLRQRK